MAIMNNSGGAKGHDPHKDRYTDPWGPKSLSDYGQYPKIPKLPEPVTINSLFPQFNRWAIGFDDLFDTFKTVSTGVKTSGYPPYNIYKNKDTYVLELAVAGFAKEDITISVKELQLTVEGELGAPQEEALHKGIATRDFKQDFVLAEYVVVKGAELKDGLLRITLEQELPEEKKPKVIEIA
jgi:molecular chaperone IbpA